jgi:CheY-like chemotaxis protein
MAMRSLDILVAEDNPVNRTLMTRFLESEGHRAKLVNNGREAVAAVLAHVFDAVLMDIQMPEMDGLAAARAIREHEVNGSTRRHVPLIAVTAHAIKGDRERCLDAGYDGYVTKPISFPELLAELAAVVQPGSEPAALSVRALKALPTFEATVASEARPASGFDEHDALARVGGDEGLLRELVGVFVTEAPAWLEELDVATAAGDGVGLHRVAHTIKGAADTCGVRGGFDAAFAVERLARAEAFDRVAIGARVAELRAVVDAALPAMRAMSEGGSAS